VKTGKTTEELQSVFLMYYPVAGEGAADQQLAE